MKLRKLLHLSAVLFALLIVISGNAQKKSVRHFAVIGYYSGNAETIDQYDVSKLTHIIYSFCHLKGNKLHVDNAADSATIKKLVSLKEAHPGLKIMLSLGGWGGCKECSPVFSTAKGRQEFANSVKVINDYFGTDGIDIDWEYPTIEGYPGHAYAESDRANFTSLMEALRKSLGSKEEISFAAGGFSNFLIHSVDWLALAPLIDRVNIMSYDLVGGYSTQTGHHTPLYDNAQEPESADHAVRYLDSLGFPRNKMVIGAAMYGRIWENVPDVNHGLYQPGKFYRFVDYRLLSEEITAANGYSFFRDSVAKAPWAYNAEKKLFVTYDDPESIALKTRYALEQGLGGIMFWELRTDSYKDGLLQVIDNVIQENSTKTE